jgi:glycosyltransferase involved in cell wall biosynthesis
VIAVRPFVTIVIPCRNEEHYLGACLDSILAGDYPPDRLEVLVADGRSDDRTREILAEYTARHPAIRLIDNPQRITPTGLNAAIRAARGDIIMRMDAHGMYPATYVSQLVAALEETEADAVGGVIETLPADDSATARAIALGMSHPLGVGNSYFRIGSRERRWTDAVSFGCYHREVFERIGLFDEDLVRNQDDEFDLRLIKHGGRLLLVPEVVSRYYARRSLRQVAHMFHQYGYFKPLVAKKLGRIMTYRQLVPGLFLLSLAASALTGLWWQPAALVGAGIVGLYAAVVLGCSAASARTHGIRVAAVLAGVFPIVHVTYGVGFLQGVVDHVFGLHRRVRNAAAIPLSR